MEKSWGRAVFETARAVFFFLVYDLFALALVAVAVRAYTPPQAVVTALNWAVKCVGLPVICALCIGREYALFKGIAAGLFSSLFSMLLFSLIGGGFAVGVIYLLELAVFAILGGAGGLIGAKFHKQ